MNSRVKVFLKISQLCMKNFEKVGSEEEERQGGRWGGLGEEYKSPRCVPLVISCFCGEAGYHSCTWEFTLWAELRQILQFIIVEPEQQMRARAQRFPFSIWCLWVSVVIKSDDKRPWKEGLAFLAFSTLVTSADTEGKFRSIREMRQRLQWAFFFR